MLQATLLDVMTTRADSRGMRIAERAAAVLFVTALTAAAAQVSIPLPFTPVPFTFQPMIVLVGGVAHAAGRRGPPARADRRIPRELSARGLHDRLARGARIRSPLPHGGPGD